MAAPHRHAPFADELAVLVPELVVLEGHLGATSGARRTCKTGPVGERLVEIEFLDAGVEADCLTFG